MTKIAVVLGVGGQIGTAVARRLVADGWSVRGLQHDTRPLPDDLGAVRVEVGDRDDDAVLSGVLRGGADAVVDTVAYRSAHARQLLAHAADLGALVVISSIDVYADAAGRSVNTGPVRLPVPVSESQPQVPADDATYGGGKVLLERILFDAGRLPVTALRPAAVCGPRSRHLREWWFIKRALDGRRAVPVNHGGRSRFHPTSTVNIAALAAHCLGLRTSQALNVADPDCPTTYEIAGHVARALDHEWRIVPVDGETGGVGDTPWSGPHPIVVDTTLAMSLGYAPATTYADAMPGLVAAAREETTGHDWREVYPSLAGYPADQFDYTTEDRFLEPGE
jgi:nucleoside-diphosphate-sugar epimerase